MFKPVYAFERQLLCGHGKARNTDAVAKHIMDIANIDWLGRNGERTIQNMLVEALARPEHHTMLAERHRLGVAIASQMANGQNIHVLCGPLIRPDYLAISGARKSRPHGGAQSMRTCEAKPPSATSRSPGHNQNLKCQRARRYPPELRTALSKFPARTRRWPDPTKTKPYARC